MEQEPQTDKPDWPVYGLVIIIVIIVAIVLLALAGPSTSNDIFSNVILNV